MLVTLLKVSRKAKPTKYDADAISVGITTEEFDRDCGKDTWLNGWEDSINASWKAGDQVEVTVKENGDYLNFTAVKPVDIAGLKARKTIRPASELPPPPGIPHTKRVSSPEQQEEKWNKIAEGKVRTLFAIEAYKIGKPLDIKTKEVINRWVDYCMTGSAPEEADINSYLGSDDTPVGPEDFPPLPPYEE